MVAGQKWELNYIILSDACIFRTCSWLHNERYNKLEKKKKKMEKFSFHSRHALIVRVILSRLNVVAWQPRRIWVSGLFAPALSAEVRYNNKQQEPSVIHRATRCARKDERNVIGEREKQQRSGTRKGNFFTDWTHTPLLYYEKLRSIS